MIRKHFRFKRLVLGLALGFVVAAVVAPAALAKPVNSDTLNGGLDPWAVGVVYQSTHPMSAQDLGPVDPWAYGLIHKATQPTSTQVYRLSGGNAATAPLVTDHGGRSLGPSVDLGPLDPWAYSLVHRASKSPAPTTIKSSSSSSGFDFGDAGIGAGVSFGVALILLGSIAFGLRYRRMHRSGLATS